jgi:hypothetical protein
VGPLVERHCRSPEIGVPASREARTAGGGRSSVEWCYGKKYSKRILDY